MPRSPTTKSSNRANPVGETDAILRKKKNADAQAAFRQRRANYITTLEETVTSLESAVMQLQESCREVQTECTECKRENDRLRQQLREREKFWRDMWQNNRRSTGEAADAVSTYPSTPSDSLPPYVYPQTDPYSTEALSYKAVDDPCYGVRTSQPYQASSTPYTPASVSADDSLSRRTQNKFTYQYTLSESGADTAAWGTAVASSSRADIHAVGATGTPHPTTFAEQAASQLNSFGYVDHRSSSPLSPTSSTTTPMYSFNGTDVVTNDRDFDIRRHSGVSCSDVMLQGSAADLTLASSSGDANRYRMAAPTYPTNNERTMLPGFSSLADNSVHYGHTYEEQTKRRSLTSVSSAPTVPASSSAQTSRSPSPGSPPLSSTIAVLKAQSFGALRRSRTRRRKSADAAGKSAADSLEYPNGDGSDEYEGA